VARIDSPPSEEIIRGFKGTLDFVKWRGIFYVRKWPVTPRSSLSAAHFQRAALFGAIVKAYSLLADEALQLYAEEAKGIPRTGRDLHVSAVLGHLHTQDMSDIQSLLERAVAALEIIDGFADPQNSIFGYDVRLIWEDSETTTNGTTHVSGPTCPADELWVITNVCAYHTDPANRRLRIVTESDGNVVTLAYQGDHPMNTTIHPQTPVILEEGDNLRATAWALAAGKKVFLAFNGYMMRV